MLDLQKYFNTKKCVKHEEKNPSFIFEDSRIWYYKY